jgi:hypothetical protein
MELAAKLLESEEEGGTPASIAREATDIELGNEEPPKSPSKSVEQADELISISEKSVYQNEDGEIIVDSQHSEILEAIEKAIEDTKKLSVSLAPSVYIQVLQNELEKLSKERLKLDPTAIG